MDSPFPDQLLQRIERCGVIAVLVIDSAAHAVPLAQALLRGGIDVMELTLRTPQAIDALRRIHAEVPEMLAGIGTVLTCDQVDTVVEAGAAFAVAPGLNPVVVRHARQRGLPFAPGVVTPSEVEQAIELGCRHLKFFPAQPSGGVKYLKSMNAPYAHLNLKYIPLGGLNATNMVDYLCEPFTAAIGGSWIAPRATIAAEDWEAISKTAMAVRETLDEIKR
jgi:2-dehydro-3-deoxyphosphogluconate aldolase/(4S)-4-hydroxy-2-oxoglutarate aldolase